jgi:hypothetical protein
MRWHSEAETITFRAGGFGAASSRHSFRVAHSGTASWLTIHAPDDGFAAFMRGLRDGIQVEWDIAPVPANHGLPADHAIVSCPPTHRGDASKPRPPRGCGKALLGCSAILSEYRIRRKASPLPVLECVGEVFDRWQPEP